ncbi:hypothetical protein [Desulfonatronospira sp.]|nr:hypothetical protein [Desulfonatronospira sp.]
MEEKVHNGHFDINKVAFIDARHVLSKIILNGDSVNSSEEKCKTYSSKN